MGLWFKITNDWRYQNTERIKWNPTLKIIVRGVPTDLVSLPKFTFEAMPLSVMVLGRGVFGRYLVSDEVKNGTPGRHPLQAGGRPPEILLCHTQGSWSCARQDQGPHGKRHLLAAGALNSQVPRLRTAVKPPNTQSVTFCVGSQGQLRQHLSTTEPVPSYHKSRRQVFWYLLYKTSSKG